MSAERLEQIRARLERFETTQAAVKALPRRFMDEAREPGERSRIFQAHNEAAEPAADFHRSSPDDIRFLLGLLDEQRAENERLCAVVDGLRRSVAWHAGLPEPDADMLEAMRAVDALQANMPPSGGDAVREVREARDGGMYGEPVDA